MPAINTNGVTLTYATQGDPKGEPVLLIMGLGMQLTSWPDTFIDGLLAHGFYVIRFDNRDSGLSSKMEQFGTPNLPLAFVKSMLRLPVSSGYGLNDMANDTVGLLDALGIGKTHIVGVSMGGMIAQIVAATYQERVLTLTSIMSTSGRRGLPGPTSAARKALLSRPKNPQDLDQVLNHMVRTFQIIGSPAYPTPVHEMRERIAAGMKRSVSATGTARQMVAIAASGDRVNLLKKIRRPSLVIHGADDPLVPLACGVDTARWIPDAVLRVIDGMGHDLAVELNQTLVQLIEAHCRGRAVPEVGFQVRVEK